MNHSTRVIADEDPKILPTCLLKTNSLHTKNGRTEFLKELERIKTMNNDMSPKKKSGKKT
jgi:hypothetical protein